MILFLIFQNRQSFLPTTVHGKLPLLIPFIILFKTLQPRPLCRNKHLPLLFLATRLVASACKLRLHTFPPLFFAFLSACTFLDRLFHKTLLAARAVSIARFMAFKCAVRLYRAATLFLSSLFTFTLSRTPLSVASRCVTRSSGFSRLESCFSFFACGIARPFFS